MVIPPTHTQMGRHSVINRVFVELINPGSSFYLLALTIITLLAILSIPFDGLTCLQYYLLFLMHALTLGSVLLAKVVYTGECNNSSPYNCGIKSTILAEHQ